MKIQAWMIFGVYLVFILMAGMILILGGSEGLAEIILPTLGSISIPFIIGYYIGKYKQRKSTTSLLKSETAKTL